MRRFLIFLLVLAVLAGLLVAFRKPIFAHTLPKVEKLTFTRIAITSDSAHVRFRLRIRNRGAWNFKLKSVTLGVFDDTTRLLAYSNDSLRTLAPDETRDEDFSVTLPVRKIIGKIREHQSEDSAYLLVQGTLLFDVFGFDAPQDFREEIAVKVPVPPKLTLREIVYTGKENGLHGLELTLRIVNRNDREFHLKNISYDITGEQLIAAHGFLPNLDIGALDSTDVKIPVQVKLKNKLGLITQVVLFKEDIDYSFVMHGTITSVEGIVENEVPATFTSNGRMKLQGNHDDTKHIRFSIRKKKHPHA